MKCKHTNVIWDGPDESVGIFGYLVGCADCDAEALAFDEDWDEQRGLVIRVTKWSTNA